jgi:hypothetical protein
MFVHLIGNFFTPPYHPVLAVHCAEWGIKPHIRTAERRGAGCSNRAQSHESRDDDPVGFPHIRRWVSIGFCTHGFVSGANLVPSGFVSPGLVLLNPDPVPMLPSKLQHYLYNILVVNL